MFATVRSKICMFFVVIGLLLQACSSPPTTTPPQAQDQPQTEPEASAPATTERTTVKVVSLPYISFAPFYIAYEEGYFEAQGLDVELIEMTNQQDIVPALASGQVDVSSGLLSVGILNTIAKGAKIQIVADKGYIDPNGCPNIALVAQRDFAAGGDVEDPDYLRGATFAQLRATWLDYYSEKLFETVGLEVDDFELTELPVAAQPEALDQGTIDLITQNEPWVTRFAQAGHKPILTPVQDLLPNSQSAVTLFGPSLLGENADVGNRFMVAYLHAVQQYNEGKTDRNVEIMAKYIQLDPELIREMCWPALRDDGHLNVESVLDFQNWAIEKKFMEQPVTAEQFWNGRFVEYASEQLEIANR